MAAEVAFVRRVSDRQNLHSTPFFKTVIAALDYVRQFAATGVAPRLLRQPRIKL